MIKFKVSQFSAFMEAFVPFAHTKTVDRDFAYNLSQTFTNLDRIGKDLTHEQKILVEKHSFRDEKGTQTMPKEKQAEFEVEQNLFLGKDLVLNRPQIDLKKMPMDFPVSGMDIHNLRPLFTGLDVIEGGKMAEPSPDASA